MNQESRREIVDRLLRFVGELNDDDARAVANDLCASAVQTIWRAHPFTEFAMAIDPTITTVAGTKFYVLPTSFGRIASKEGVVRNLTTGNKIWPIRGVDLESRYPTLDSAIDTTTGEPTHYTIAGTVGVATQVAAAGEALEAVSDSLADTDVVLQIEGIDENGDYSTIQVTLNAQTPVALGTWKFVQSVGKSYPASETPPVALNSSDGSVFVRKVGGGARLTLLWYESSREYYSFRLHPTPDAIYSIAIPTIRRPRRVFQDADALPADWGDALFEEMRLQWAVNTGELSPAAAAAAPRPQLLSLIGYDNELRPAARLRKRAFGVGR